MDKVAKEAFVGELKQIFEGASAGILVDYRGLEANELVDLRKKLFEVSSKIKIVKNTLAKIAAVGTPFEGLSEHFIESRALIFSATNPVGQAKVLEAFIKDHTSLKIQAGLLAREGRISLLSDQDISALAKLPSREDLIVKILFLMQAPVSQFVRTLHEVPAKFVRTLAAIAESKK